MKYFPTPNEHQQHTPHCGYDRKIKIFSQANALDMRWNNTSWITHCLRCRRELLHSNDVAMCAIHHNGWMHGLTRDTLECNSCWRITSIKKGSLRWISTSFKQVEIGHTIDVCRWAGIDIVPKEIWSARNLRFARFLFTSKVGIICV